MDQTPDHALGAGGRTEVETEMPDLMGQELADGPRAVETTLAEVDRVRPELDGLLVGAGRLVLVGTGASLAVAHIAAPELRRRGARAAVGVRWAGTVLVRQSSDIVLGGLDGEQFGADDLVIAISQSGASPETLAAAGDARTAGACVLAVTARRDSPLGALASIVLPIGSGVERSAATKSSLATTAGLLAMAGSLPTDEVSVTAMAADLRAAVAEWDGAASLGRDLAAAGRVWWLGYGMGMGIAEAGSLLWHEKVIRQAVAATPSEFRHGLIEAARSGDAVGLIEVDPSDPRRTVYLDRLRRELGILGVRLVELAPPADSPAVRALQALLRVQQLAHATAIAAGTYRDDFAVLRRVVTPASELVG